MGSIIDHIAIKVDDLETAEEWYCEKLNAEVTFRDEKYFTHKRTFRPHAPVCTWDSLDRDANILMHRASRSSRKSCKTGRFYNCIKRMARDRDLVPDHRLKVARQYRSRNGKKSFFFALKS